MKIRWKSIFLLFLLFVFLASCRSKYNALDLEIYQYRDTKKLVKFVYDCSQSFKNNGRAQLRYFQQHREEFNRDDYYLYVYKMDGTNVFHSGMPELEGKNLLNISDINGKKISRLVLAALQNEHNPHAWVHFSWWQPGKFFPVPKSSCHFQVTTADGTEYFVGGGLDYPHEEKEFIRIIVDTAAAELQNKGVSCLETIADPRSQYNFREVKTFVINPNGQILISPVAGNNVFEFDIMQCQDEVGHKPFAKALQSLQNHDSTWQIFMTKNRYKRILEKKTMYLKKVTYQNEEYIVGAITELPQPPWSG